MKRNPAHQSFSLLACLSIACGLACIGSAAPTLESLEKMPGLLSPAVESAKTPQQDWTEEFTFLEREIERIGQNHFNLPRLTQESLRESAVYRASDHSPSDIVLRRTKALLAHLMETQENKQTLEDKRLKLEAWEQSNIANPPQDRAGSLASFKELCAIRREISFSNKLLSGLDNIVFLTHFSQRDGKGEIHIVDQFFGFNAKPGGSPFILQNAFSDHPVARPMIQNTPISNGNRKGQCLKDGSFVSLELTYNADRLYFAWTQALSTPVTGKEDWSKNFGTYEDLMQRPPDYHHYFWEPARVYHIYSLNLNNGELLQLTNGSANTLDPCELPSGRIAYISDEQGANQRCGARWIGAGVLHSMNPDGSDAYPLSFHETNEWQPSVSNEGMILYTRWDYVDRDSDGAHHLWQCYPDGRDPRALHGNYTNKRESRPWAELSYRSIPGSNKLIAVAAPHHGVAYGSLILVDPSVPDDGATSQIRRLTPEIQFPEAESLPGFANEKGRMHGGEHVGTPWPLSEDFHLCVYDRNGHNYGLYLIDSFGNKELLWQDAHVPCLDPIPLLPRKRPGIIPDMTTQSIARRPNGEPESTTAETFIFNVYDAERPLPEGVKVKWIRVVNIFPKSNVFSNEPNIGMGDQSLARGSLGIAPVEEDGSAFFLMPTNVNVYFQLLDENKQAIQSMRSSTYAHSGERLSCMGCHESRFTAPRERRMGTSLALKRKPSLLMPEPAGSNPMIFARLVQPVLNNNCVQCHEKNAPKAPRLDGDTFRSAKGEQRNNKFGWSNSYKALHPWAWTRHGGNGAHWDDNKFTYSIPGDVGAQASKLLPFLKKGHQNLKLSPNDLYRITLWMDLNSNFYGDYKDTEAQARGETVTPKFGTPKPPYLFIKQGTSYDQ